MKVIFLAFLFLSFLHEPLFAQSPTLKPQRSSLRSTGAQGMSALRLAKIDRMLQTTIDKNELPGAVALISRNGEVIFHKAYGMADHEELRPMDPNDIFRIASQTKAITATAVMMLWEEGHFSLDDPIAKYLPAFKDPRILDSFNEADTTYTTRAAKNPITIRHLLTHTSGIGYGVIDTDARFRKIYAKAGVTDLFTTKDITIGENVQKLAGLPLHHNPGAHFTYSEGLDVLGHFVETISRMPFDQFLRTRIFIPLGMDDTWFYLPKKKEKRLVTLQHKENGKWAKYPISFYDPDYPIRGAKRFFSGGAGLCSTAKDYAKFLQMYLNEGMLNGTRLLSRTTVQTIMGNQTGDKFSDSSKYYGLAFGIVTKKGQDLGGIGSMGTFDWGGYFNTLYFADPNENIIGILLKQTAGKVNDPTGWKFRQMVFAAVDD